MKLLLKIFGAGLLVLLGLGAIYYSFLSDDEKQQIEMEATAKQKIEDSLKIENNDDFKWRILEENEHAKHVVIENMNGAYKIGTIIKKLQIELCPGKSCVLFVWDDVDSYEVRKYKFDNFVSENFNSFNELNLALNEWEKINYVIYAEHQLATIDGKNVEFWPLMDKKYRDLGGKKLKSDIISY
jgi:hypothetical protein